LTINFIDNIDKEEPGSVGYLRLVRDRQNPKLINGGLLIVNSRAEPLEFVFGQVRRPNTNLRIFGDDEVKAQALLVRGLFASTKETPLIIYALSEELADGFFKGLLTIEIPILSFSNISTGQMITGTWSNGIHFQDGSPQAVVHDVLIKNGLIYEPFDKTLDGIIEASSKPV